MAAYRQTWFWLRIDQKVTRNGLSIIEGSLRKSNLKMYPHSDTLSLRDSTYSPNITPLNSATPYEFMEVIYTQTTIDVYNGRHKDTLQNRWIPWLKLFYVDESLQIISKNKIEEIF